MTPILVTALYAMVLTSPGVHAANGGLRADVGAQPQPKSIKVAVNRPKNDMYSAPVDFARFLDKDGQVKAALEEEESRRRLFTPCADPSTTVDCGWESQRYVGYLAADFVSAVSGNPINKFVVDPASVDSSSNPVQGLKGNKLARAAYTAAIKEEKPTFEKTLTVTTVEQVRAAFSAIPLSGFPIDPELVKYGAVGASIFTFGFVSIFFMWITHCLHCCACGRKCCKYCSFCFCSARCGKIFCAFMLFLAAIVLCAGFLGRNMFQAAAKTAGAEMKELGDSFQALSDGGADLTAHVAWYQNQFGLFATNINNDARPDATVSDTNAGLMWCDPAGNHGAPYASSYDATAPQDGNGDAPEQVFGFHTYTESLKTANSNDDLASNPNAAAAAYGTAGGQLPLITAFAEASEVIGDSLAPLLLGASTFIETRVTPNIDKGLAAMVAVIWILVIISVIAVFTSCKADDCILLVFGTAVLIVVLVAICIELTVAVVVSDICQKGPDVAIPDALETWAGLGPTTDMGQQIKYIIDCDPSNPSPLDAVFNPAWETIMVFNTATERDETWRTATTQTVYGKYKGDIATPSVTQTTWKETGSGDAYDDPNQRNKGDAITVHGCDVKASDEVADKTEDVVKSLYQIWENYSCPPGNKAYVNLMYDVVCKNLLGGMAQIAAIQLASWLMIMLVFFMMPCANDSAHKVMDDDGEEDDHEMEDD